MSNKIMEVQDISKNVTTIKEKDLNRNWGIDLLRIVSMLYIVLLHSLGQGGLLIGTIENSIKDYSNE